MLYIDVRHLAILLGECTEYLMGTAARAPLSQIQKKRLTTEYRQSQTEVF
jgi:hypothetical protein